MGRARVNPFDQGTAERVLYDRYRKADASARKAERERDLAAADAAANKFADALRALGHGDKVPGQVALGHGDKVPGQVALGHGDKVPGQVALGHGDKVPGQVALPAPAHGS